VAPTPEISVVIPTRNGAERLPRCLTALAGQTAAPRLETIVVDDGSENVSRVAEVVRAFPPTRLVRQEARGVAAARNSGIRSALGSVVCFTDDDCAPAPDWAEQLAAAINAGADAAGGLTLPARPDNVFDVTTQNICNFAAEYAAVTRPQTMYLAGSNLAARRSVLLEVLFDERFRGAAEDRDWCARLVAARQVIARVPGAVVLHAPGLDLKGFVRKHVHYGRGAYTFRRFLGSDWKLESPGFYRALLAQGFESGLLEGLLTVAAQVSTAAGFVYERARDGHGRFRRRSPTKAVILAAGSGTRLGRIHGGLPKCLLELGGRTLIERQLDALRAVDISSIIVVVGCEADRVRGLRQRGLAFIENPRFRETDSLYSLWLARHQLPDGFVLANSDVLFDPLLLADLVNDPHEDALLISRTGDAGSGRLDEEATKVKVTNGRVVDIGKELDMSDADGEYVGIAKFGPSGSRQLLDIVDGLVSRGRQQDIVPHALRELLTRQRVYAVDARRPWIEIDFEHDLHRAATLILPAIATSSPHQSGRRRPLASPL
jgi:choline kinase/GT2 family glycosyltransferase